MGLTFYQYIQKFTDYDANDPMSRLANAIHQDHAFPKHTTDFDKISDYLESSSHYTKLVSIFDEAWSKYQWDMD
ncbi:sterile alpha motif-like domain-containing protein [Aerococcaceae bacterium zg-ZUI334]|uniref:YozE family protein n=1 Tax=Aerococcaceae TaxID=186827 RepID=UPI0013B828D6|nr:MULTISPECIES: YozE family protein [unclassified Facklamia]MBR7928311.1 sterile alpha motif-like domain-containing protein [Aerococcaceae bacterium zg-ZUI334]MBS4461112.1 sterile alpha motif-like domain-containing protein [Aerococcaceae bacterium zg-B36]QQD64860.1 sterile alpha motif-like domain-containing protein [Aerococcaceae bacterium zg-252]NEW64399.1 hypothetical protein [Facklamia sp. 252]NEW68480.1 hypothetical protein [Facklamia sp. 253]